MKKQKGFTLVEMMVSLAIGMTILMAIYAMVNIAQKSTINVERKVYAHQDARAAMDVMALEIQMASYNPRPDLLNNNFWAKPVSCAPANTPAERLNRGIQQATPTAITVEMNLSGSDNIGDNVLELVRYAYDASNQCIIRYLDCSNSTISSSNAPFLGNLGIYSWEPRSVRVINTANVPVFRYFNGQGTEISSNLLPARIPDIARIDITLWVETDAKDQSTGKRRQMVYSTSVIPRNHVLNR